MRTRPEQMTAVPHPTDRSQHLREHQQPSAAALDDRFDDVRSEAGERQAAADLGHRQTLLFGRAQPSA